MADTGSPCTVRLLQASVHHLFAWRALQPYGSIQNQAKRNGLHNRNVTLWFLPSPPNGCDLNTNIASSPVWRLPPRQHLPFCDRVLFSSLPSISQENGTTHHWPWSAAMRVWCLFGIVGDPFPCVGFSSSCPEILTRAKMWQTVSVMTGEEIAL